jgi:ketopantoate hydroxymethyltransferase
MRDVMEAADVTEVSNAAETAMDGAGAVEAAMEGVPARVTAGMTAAVSSPVPSTTVSAASDRDRR